MILSMTRCLFVLGALVVGLSLVFCSGAPTPPETQADAVENTAESTTAAPGPAELEARAEAPAPARTAPEVSPGAAPAAAPEPAAADSADFSPARAVGAVVGTPAPTNTAPIIAVANYFAELPGIDMSTLSPQQKEKFLHRVNSELCTCGCKNDTLAHCLVNDPACPVVKGMVLTVLEEVKSGS